LRLKQSPAVLTPSHKLLFYSHCLVLFDRLNPAGVTDDKRYLQMRECFSLCLAGVEKL